MIPILGAVNKMVPGNHVEWQGINDVVRWINTWTITRKYRRFGDSERHHLGVLRDTYRIHARIKLDNDVNENHC